MTEDDYRDLIERHGYRIVPNTFQQGGEPRTNWYVSNGPDGKTVACNTFRELAVRLKLEQPTIRCVDNAPIAAAARAKHEQHALGSIAELKVIEHELEGSYVCIRNAEGARNYYVARGRDGVSSITAAPPWLEDFCA